MARQLYAALVFVVVAGTMAVLLSVGLRIVDVSGDAWGGVVLILAGMWIPQQLITAARYRRP